MATRNGDGDTPGETDPADSQHEQRDSELVQSGQCSGVEEEEEEADEEEEGVFEGHTSLGAPLQRVQEEALPPPSTVLDLLLSRAGSVWGTSKCISKWRMAHRRGYHISQYTQDPAYKEIIMRHELDYRTSIPLPLVCAIEREVLQILQNTATDYASQLGSQHSLTQEVKQRIEDLSVRVSCKTEDDLFLPRAGVWRRALAALWALAGVWRQK
ncbi:uncharacterized protein [Lepisosteus oculatus]|uniref:uncharacterized protein n=1 Tax=Lepisosteus oculatus TaxID=7918 RepID=UPI0035F521BE